MSDFALAGNEDESGWVVFTSSEPSVEMLAMHPTKGVRIYGHALSPTPENAAELWKAFGDWMRKSNHPIDSLVNEHDHLIVENQRLREAATTKDAWIAKAREALAMARTESDDSPCNYQPSVCIECHEKVGHPPDCAIGQLLATE